MEILLTNSQLESTADPVETQLEIPEAGESDRTAEVEPHIISAIMEEAPAEIKEDRPVLGAPQVRQLLPSYHLYLLTVNPSRTILACPKKSTQNLSTLNLFQKTLLWSRNRN